MAEYGSLIYAKSEAGARQAAEDEYRRVAATVGGLSPMRFLDLGCPLYGVPLYRIWGWVAESDVV